MVATLVLSFGCTQRAVRVPVAAAGTPIDNSYTDLKPGERLRIVVPLLKSGGYLVATSPVAQEGNTIALSAAGLIGYEVSYYAIQKRSNGRVRLHFTSAESSKDGKTVPEEKAPALPFALPAKAAHIRLIYLVRSSRSDHNMAITASTNLEALDVFTSQLKSDPEVCKNEDEVSCSWVPAGIAVRPEPLSSSD